MSIEEARSESETFDCEASELAEIGAIVDCAQEAAQLLKLLANEKRLVILCFLATRGEARWRVGRGPGAQRVSPVAASGQTSPRRPRPLPPRVPDPALSSGRSARLARARRAQRPLLRCAL